MSDTYIQVPIEGATGFYAFKLRVTNTSGGAVAVNVALEWYEGAV